MKKVFLTVLLLSLCCSCTLLLNDNSGTISLELPQLKLNRALPEDLKNDINAPNSYTVKLTAERGTYKLIKTFLPGQLIKIENIPVGNYELIVYGENNEFEFEAIKEIVIKAGEVTTTSLNLVKYNKKVSLKLNLSEFQNETKYQFRITSPDRKDVFIKSNSNQYIINNEIIKNQNNPVEFYTNTTYVVEILEEAFPDIFVLVGIEQIKLERTLEKDKTVEIKIPLNRKYLVTGTTTNSANRSYQTVQEAITAIQNRSKNDVVKSYQIITQLINITETGINIDQPIKLYINKNPVTGDLPALEPTSNFITINNKDADIIFNEYRLSVNMDNPDSLIQVQKGKLTLNKCLIQDSAKTGYLIYLGSNSLLEIGADGIPTPQMTQVPSIFLENGAAIKPEFPNKINPPIPLKLAPDYDTSKPVMILAPGSSLIPDQHDSFSITNSTGTKSYALKYDGTVTEVL